MTKKTAIKVFNEKQIRSHWDDDGEKWYFSIVDVVGILTESANPRKYWSAFRMVCGYRKLEPDRQIVEWKWATCLRD